MATVKIELMQQEHEPQEQAPAENIPEDNEEEHEPQEQEDNNPEDDEYDPDHGVFVPNYGYIPVQTEVEELARECFRLAEQVGAPAGGLLQVAKKAEYLYNTGINKGRQTYAILADVQYELIGDRDSVNRKKEKK
uniref:Uncharacterized protein n=1 Tax=Anopheles atroparvus TaxID=41427 RepID=A0AAG5DU76_ANOAO